VPQDFARREVEDDGDFRPRAVTRRVRLERRGRHHGELRLELRKFGVGRDDEEVPDEQVLPGQFMNEADRQAVLLIGAGVQVLHEQFLRLEVIDDVAAQDVVVCGLNRLVDLTPPHVGIAARLLHDELVVGRAAGVSAGAADQRALNGQLPFLTTDGVLVQRRGRQIEMDGLGPCWVVLI
jgi:hypothetical protein